MERPFQYPSRKFKIHEDSDLLISLEAGRLQDHKEMETLKTCYKLAFAGQTAAWVDLVVCSCSTTKK